MYFTEVSWREAVPIYSHWTGRSTPSDMVPVNCHTWIAKDDGEIVAVAQLVIIHDPIWDRRWGLIENVFTHPQRRREGIARQLIQCVETAARFDGCEFVKLTSANHRAEAHKLYSDSGYIEGKSFRKDLK